MEEPTDRQQRRAGIILLLIVGCVTWYFMNTSKPPEMEGLGVEQNLYPDVD